MLVAGAFGISRSNLSGYKATIEWFSDFLKHQVFFLHVTGTVLEP